MSRHPLRGNLFENLVVIEVFKYRYNRGRRNNLNFWRDAKGNEVDLVIEVGSDVVPVEIKSGATISEDFFKGLRTFSAKLSTPPSSCALVYGGTEQQQRSEAGVWRVGDVAEMMEMVSG